MSLASASGLIGHTKEYMYRGIQQLPLIMSLTSFFLAVTTASIAHTMLFVGLSTVIPLFTLGSQWGLGKILLLTMPDRKNEWSRSSVDVCKIIPSPESFKSLSYYVNDDSASVTPSYWITSIGFIFGYLISNGFDTLDKPIAPGADPIGHDKRYTQAIHILVASFIFFILIVGARFYFMGDCEGRGLIGRVFGMMFAVISSIIGVAFYYTSRECGARSSDLFGVLSQMLPASALAPTPTVCTESQG